MVSKIYANGIATGIATFETKTPTWEVWNNKYIKSCRLVIVINDLVVGYAVLSPTSKRPVYKGVAEVTVYIAEEFRGQHLGKSLLKQLIEVSEKYEFWTLQASIFSKNKASIALHEKCEFRVVGIRERIGKLKEEWFDNVLMERRSRLIN